MSHLDVDIFEFLILTIIPVAALFIIEMICRVVKVQSWPKLAVQGIVMVSFGIAYLTMETPHTLTAIERITSAFATISNNFSFTKFFCSNLRKLNTTMILRKPMLRTKWIMAIITFKRHICHIPTVCTFFC